MKPRFYIDMKLISSQDSELSTPVLANHAVRILHGAFRDQPGQFALALPACEPGKATSVGQILRVFATKPEPLMLLLGCIEGHHFVRDYCQLSTIVAVPEDFSGAWVRYQRYRTSNRNSERKKEGIPLRERRIARAAERGFPYFQVTSKSNMHGFRLYIEAILDKAPDSSNEANPDSYGLAVSSRPFALPAVPYF